MKLSLRPVTIQGRLLAIFIVAAALPLAVVSLISYHNSVESVEKMVGNRTSKIAVSVGTELSDKLRKRLDDRLLLNNEPVQHFLDTVSHDDDPDANMEARANLRTFMSSLFQQYGLYYSEIILADANGVPVFRHGASRGTEEAPPPIVPSLPTVPGAPTAPTLSVTKPTLDDTLDVFFPDEIPLPKDAREMGKNAEQFARDMKKQLHNRR